MSKSPRSYRTTASRSLILAIAGTVFLSIAAAGASAAPFSFFDAVRAFFGMSETTSADAPTVGPPFINEILFNPPGTDGPNEYVEIRGVANSTIAANTYLVGIEGDSSGPGDVQLIFNLSGLTFGSNGYLIIRQMGNTYVVDGAATSITATGTGFTGAAGFQADGTATDIENASASFLLIQAATAPLLTDDIDADNDGVADGAVYGAWTIIDAGAGVVDNATDSAYTPVVFSTSATFVGSAGRDVVLTTTAMGYLARQGTSSGNTSASDWFAGALGAQSQIGR